jgi:hypothetical protein
VETSQDLVVRPRNAGLLRRNPGRHGPGVLTWYEDNRFVFQPQDGRPTRFGYIDPARWQRRTMTVYSDHHTIRLFGAVDLLDATIDVVPTRDQASSWMARLRTLSNLFEDPPHEVGTHLGE